MRENLLKRFYKLDEKGESPGKARSRKEIFKKSSRQTWLETICMIDLRRHKWVEVHQGNPEMYTLTESGQKMARRIVRRHRLWETYLSQRLELDHEHVHQDADLMEHVLNEELENKIIAFLGKPEKDPHNSIIPYD